MKYVIDWTLDRSSFRRLIDGLIETAVKEGKVIPLPLEIRPGSTFINLAVTILSQVDCSGCDARCCRANQDGTPISITLASYRVLERKLGKSRLRNSGVKVAGQQCYFPIPCPFLYENRCTIYPHRPFVCIFYPLSDPGEDSSGGPLLSLESRCPEARRIARQVYMCAWELRGKLNELKLT